MGKKKEASLPSLRKYSDEAILSEWSRRMRARQEAPNPKKLSPCKWCGELKGVAEMRAHRPICPEKPLAKPKAKAKGKTVA